MKQNNRSVITLVMKHIFLPSHTHIHTYIHTHCLCVCVCDAKVRVYNRHACGSLIPRRRHCSDLHMKRVQRALPGSSHFDAYATRVSLYSSLVCSSSSALHCNMRLRKRERERERRVVLSHWRAPSKIVTSVPLRSVTRPLLGHFPNGAPPPQSSYISCDIICVR